MRAMLFAVPVLLALAGCTVAPVRTVMVSPPPMAVAIVPAQLDFDRDGIADVDDRFPYDPRAR